MKKFLLHTFGFSLMVLAVLAAGEWYVERLPNPSKDKHRWMSAHSRQVETLVLGSSHTFYGIDPEVLGNGAFSLAQVSQTYRYDRWLLSHYPMPRLRTVVLPFSYFSLYEDFEMGIGDDYASRYLLYMDCPIHSRFSRYGLELLNADTFKEKLKSLWKPSALTWTERGFASNYRLEARAENWDNGEERAYGNTYADTAAVALNCGFLHDICAWCAERDVQVVLLSTPLTETYRRHRDSVQLVRNERLLSALLRTHPEVVYLNFEADPRFVSDDFYDSDHLSTLGAEKLSRILRDTLLVR